MALKEIPFYGEARLARMRASTSILPATVLAIAPWMALIVVLPPPAK